MKKSKIPQITAIILLVVISFYSNSNAQFHSGGVAACEGCHTMHNSLDGVQMTTSFPQFQAGAYLLRATDPGSVCLNCHQQAGAAVPNSYLISTADSDMPAGLPPKQLPPGGDFGWLKKTYNWTGGGGSPQTSKGERHGHNIIAADYGYATDTTITTAPGGDTFQYPSNKLSCISCHDPHGRYRITAIAPPTGVTFAASGKPIKDTSSYGTTPTATFAVGTYRLLAGINYQPKSLVGAYSFAYNPFVAVAPTTYNRSEAVTDTRVAYGRDVSNWCANCHALMHTLYGTGEVHSTGMPVTTQSIIDNYNRYVKTANLSGSFATAFTSLVPVQRDNISDLNALKTLTTATTGMQNGDRVMCLTCHRAHASGWDSMTRFPLGHTFMTLADGTGNPVYPDPVTDPSVAMGRTIAEFQQALYDRPPTKFAIYQRNLCSKCHLKD